MSQTVHNTAPAVATEGQIIDGRDVQSGIIDILSRRATGVRIRSSVTIPGWKLLILNLFHSSFFRPPDFDSGLRPNCP